MLTRQAEFSVNGVPGLGAAALAEDEGVVKVGHLGEVVVVLELVRGQLDHLGPVEQDDVEGGDDLVAPRLGAPAPLAAHATRIGYPPRVSHPLRMRLEESLHVPLREAILHLETAGRSSMLGNQWFRVTFCQ